jgi:hypothetical protein
MYVRAPTPDEERRGYATCGCGRGWILSGPGPWTCMTCGVSVTSEPAAHNRWGADRDLARALRRSVAIEEVG